MRPARLRVAVSRFCHGWAAQSRGLWTKLGPELRAAFGAERDDDGALRRTIAATIDRLTADFPPDQRAAVRFAFAVHEKAAYPTLTARQQAFAATHSLGLRTARRRISDAQSRFAEALEEDLALREADPDPDTGWTVARLAVLLRLDTDGPTLQEDRTIVAAREGLPTITARLSVPPVDGVSAEVRAEVQQGATLRGGGRVGPAHFRYLVDLPRPLRHGAQHRYRISYRLRPGDLIRPHYAFVPLVACEVFTMTVRFDPQAPPAKVWTLRALAPRELDAPPVDEPLTVDGAGEVELTFTRMRPGFAYGVAWTPAGARIPRQPAHVLAVQGATK